MYSIALCSRCFEWKMLSLSGPKALISLQILIALITRYAVNVCAIFKDFVSVNNRVSPEEVYLDGWMVLDGYVDSNLPDERSSSGRFHHVQAGVVLCLTFCSVINYFNSSPQLGDICLLVQGLNKISPLLAFVYVDAVLYVIIQSWHFKRGGLTYGKHIKMFQRRCFE